ncbi:hypothetical protein SDC9_129477 [bioreactor metagenome]|uniref:Uncharacterized protein n=1 Tax=bioreactor metagenome TaxID=1076179 RepID=A0A645CZ33_9ZZZZ
MRKVALANVFAMDNLAGVLARNSALGGFVEPERVDVVVEFVDARRLCDVDHCDIAGVAECFGKCFVAMSARLPATYLFQPEGARAVAVEGALCTRCACVDARRSGDHVEHGSGFVGIRHDSRARHRHELGYHIARRIVQVEGRIRGNRNDFARVGVHNQAGNTDWPVDLVALLEVFFQIALCNRVTGNRHIIALNRGDVFRRTVGKRIVLSVYLGYEQTVRARKVGVVLRLQTGLPFRLNAGKTDQLRKELSKRVVPLHVGGIADAVAELQRFELVNDRAFHLALELHLQF